MYHYLCMRKYYDGLINLELTFYNKTTHQVKNIKCSCIKSTRTSEKIEKILGDFFMKYQLLPPIL